MPTRRNHASADVKANVAVAAMTGHHTVNALATSFGGHPHHVLQGKQQALEAMPEAFSARRVREAHDEEACKAQRSQQLGQRNVELDWLKKKLDARLKVKRQVVEPAPPVISVRRQGHWLGLSRSGLYDQPGGATLEHRALMHRLAAP